MSIIQDGIGFPVLTPAVYHYMVSGDITGTYIADEHIPHAAVARGYFGGCLHTYTIPRLSIGCMMNLCIILSFYRFAMLVMISRCRKYFPTVTLLISCMKPVTGNHIQLSLFMTDKKLSWCLNYITP